MIKPLKEYLNFANKFSEVSGNILKKKFNKSFNIETKNDGSLVTEADKEIESLFRDSLIKKYPSHGILGEEFGEYNINSSHLWVIDPLDGTHNFIAGKPLFGTLICLIINNVPSMGIIDIPVLGERWTGIKGNGVHKNNKLCCFDKKKKKLKDAILASTSLLMFNQKETKVIKRIYEKIRFPVFGTDCYAYGLLLSGKIDLIIESKMKPWDYMAQVSLIKEFGGIISDWSGKELTPKSNGDVIASYSEECYQEAIKYLAKIK